jgi:DNA-binding CsgD family transcriptional regulator
LAGCPFFIPIKRGAAILRKTKKFQQLFGEKSNKNEKTPSTPSGETLVFCEKNSGEPRFKVDMAGDRELAFSRAASLLALGCMVRGDSPADYAVWVPAEDSTIERIKKHADELLHLGRAFSCPVDISPREGEVLKELLHNRLNKEIADRLRISVRTVKFHVSSLLAKFGVGSRWDLIQKARPMLATPQLTENFAALQPADSSVSASAAQSTAASAAKENSKQCAEDRVVPFRGRLRHA